MQAAEDEFAAGMDAMREAKDHLEHEKHALEEGAQQQAAAQKQQAAAQQAAAVAGAYATTPGASEQASSRKRMRAAGQQQGASLQPDELHPGPLEQQQEQGQGQGQAEPPADLAMITDRRHAEQAEQAMS